MSRSENALCIRIPAFALRLEMIRRREGGEGAVALLTEGERGERGRIGQLCEKAAAMGIRPGMRVSRALSLAPALHLLEPDPLHHAEMMERIMTRLEEATPIVSPESPGVIHLGIDGLERLHPSLGALCARVLALLGEVLPRTLLGEVRLGAAPGLFAARVATHAACPGRPVLVSRDELLPFLAPHPVSVLPLPEEALERLERLEIRTLGEFAALRLPALMRHFGGEGREAWALARGERIDPVLPRSRPLPIRVEEELPAPAGEKEMLVRAFDRMILRALARPERNGRSIRALRYGGRLEGRGSWEIELTLRERSARREDLLFPLASRIGVVPPPRALESLFLEFVDFDLPSEQVALLSRKEEGGREEGSSPLQRREVARALRRAMRELTLRLGRPSLYRVVEVDPGSRLPERRHALMAWEP